MPLAIVVVANGRLWRSMTLRSRSGSPIRMADDPITAIGRLAAASTSPARAMASSEAGALLAPATGIAGTGSLVGASATSSGRSRCTGPFGSLIASRIASASVSAMRPFSSRIVALVIGPNSAWWSIHIWMRRPSWSVLRLQVMAIIGERSRIGAADAGREIRRARPERRDAEPRRAGHAAGHIGGESGRPFMRGENEVDAALAHRLHQRKHVAARNAEAPVDARRLQGCDDQVGIVHEAIPVDVRPVAGGGVAT